MKCPKCQIENRSGIKFCNKCGHNLQTTPDPLVPKKTDFKEKKVNSHFEDSNRPFRIIDGERKYVTVLFSDLSGYTAMSEKLDPEEVKEITSRIFC